MKKLFVSLFSILFLFSAADDCLARPGRSGERGGQPPRHSQSRMNRSSRSASGSAATTQSADSDSASDSNREEGGFSQNRRSRGMNPISKATSKGKAPIFSELFSLFKTA